MVNLNQNIDEKMCYEKFCEALKKEIPLHIESDILPWQVKIYLAGYKADASSQLGQALIYQANNGNLEDSVLEQDCLVIDKIVEIGVAFAINTKMLYEAYQANNMDVVLDAIFGAYGTLERAIGIAPNETDDAAYFS